MGYMIAMDIETRPEMPAPSHSREDGWTPQAMEVFIAALIETGSVRKAARNAGRHVSSAYRTRSKVPRFAAAWDAARRMAYARLRDEAMERALDGTRQEVWHDGAWIGTTHVYSDRLLMNLLNHLKPESPPNAMRPRAIDDIEDERSDAIGDSLDILAALPPPTPPNTRLRPARLRLRANSVNGVDLAST